MFMFQFYYLHNKFARRVLVEKPKWKEVRWIEMIGFLEESWNDCRVSYWMKRTVCLSYRLLLSVTCADLQRVGGFFNSPGFDREKLSKHFFKRIKFLQRFLWHFCCEQEISPELFAFSILYRLTYLSQEIGLDCWRSFCF